MTMRIKSFVAIGILFTSATATVVWGGPEANHPNIIAAREDAQHAIEKMRAAQVANEYDMAGHAAKAERLLAQAEREMKLAAEAANMNGKKK
jgi:hypothetical protein